jgi:hypothetical protein
MDQSSISESKTGQELTLFISFGIQFLDLDLTLKIPIIPNFHIVKKHGKRLAKLQLS